MAASLEDLVMKTLAENLETLNIRLRYDRDVSEVLAKDIRGSDLCFKDGILFTKNSHFLGRNDKLPDVCMDSVSNVQIECIENHQANGDYMVCVKSLTGKTACVHVNASTLVSELKERILHVTDTPPEQQRLIFAGRQLEDERTLCDYDIIKDSTVHLVLRLRGGMHHLSSGRVDYCSTIRPDNSDLMRGAQCIQACEFSVNGRGRYFMHPLCKLSTLRMIIQMETDPDYFTKCPGELPENVISMLSHDAAIRYHTRPSDDTSESELSDDY